MKSLDDRSDCPRFLYVYARHYIGVPPNVVPTDVRSRILPTPTELFRPFCIL